MTYSDILTQWLNRTIKGKGAKKYFTFCLYFTFFKIWFTGADSGAPPLKSRERERKFIYKLTINLKPTFFNVRRRKCGPKISFNKEVEIVYLCSILLKTHLIFESLITNLKG